MKATSSVQQLCFPNDRHGQNCRGSALIKDDDLAQSAADALHTRARDSATFVPNPLKDRIPSSVGVGFNLRKRTFNDSNMDDSDAPMASCNSAFLSGLFADIAKANVTHEVEQSPCSSPVKRSRLTMTKSISRCAKSFANLATIQGTESKSFRVPPSTNAPVSRTDSLSYQLHCVSSSSSNESEDIGKIAFPHLPATVSDSSCTHLANLTRRNSGLLRQETEIINNSGESYGWFVNMDEDDETVATVPTHADSSNSLCDLAFSAATAPKRCHHEAEVEWAKAADTVDDVLGDFF